MGAHVSVCPNHQSGRTTPFETRGIVASAGTFGYELDLMKMSEEDKKTARENPKVVKAIEHVAEELGEDGRILVRESGTEPVIRVMVEASDDELCVKYVKEVVDVMSREGLVIE